MRAKPKSVCYGLLNKTQDSLFVLFADYDKAYLHVVVGDIRNLIKRFPKDFTNFAVFESTESVPTRNGTLGSYHVVNFSKLPYHVMRDRLSHLAVDDDFFKLPKGVPYKANTLRVSPKFEWKEKKRKGVKWSEGKVLKSAPRFLFWYPAFDKLSPKREVSSAHLRAYELLCGLPKFYFAWKNEDELKAVQIKKYESARN